MIAAFNTVGIYCQFPTADCRLNNIHCLNKESTNKRQDQGQVFKCAAIAKRNRPVDAKNRIQYKNLEAPLAIW